MLKIKLVVKMKKIMKFLMLFFVVTFILGCGNVSSSKQTASFTDICTQCDSSNDCSGACDAACLNRGYEGQEGSSGYDKDKYLGLKKEVTCTCRCYKYS